MHREIIETAEARILRVYTNNPSLYVDMIVDIMELYRCDRAEVYKK